jgi:ATP-binding cassette subfamily A (ABC1) protein 3
MSILCGLSKPSSGSVTFTSKPSIGVCFQRNILFDNLTVKEHIYFFCILKGLSEIQANYEVKKFIKLLKFEEKSSKFSSTLSGGMKRKLSLAIALCGYSKIVLLDEVSSGVDPTTQKDLWNLLQKEKRGRTILLSTHSMAEAEILGDRVAILCEGKLKGFGSVSELKEKYCNNVKLNCSFLSENCENFKNFLRNFDEDMKVFSENGNEIVFKMKKLENFKELLNEVERKKFELNLSNFDVNSSSLEDLFVE